MTGRGEATTNPSRLHLTFQVPYILSCVPSTGVETIERITDWATNTTFTRVSSGVDVSSCQPSGASPWSKGSSGLSKTRSVDVTGLGGVLADSLSSAKYLGDEILDGVNVYHLQISRTSVKSSTVASSTTTITNDIYVHRVTAYPFKIVTRATNGS